MAEPGWLEMLMGAAMGSAAAGNPDPETESGLDDEAGAAAAPAGGLTDDEFIDAAGGVFVFPPFVDPEASHPKPKKARLATWKNQDDPKGHIKAMGDAIRANDVPLVKKLRAGFPLHMFQRPMDYDDIDSLRDDPVAIAAKCNHLQCLDVLVNYPKPAFTADHIFWPQEKDPKAPYMTVFEKFLSEPVHKRRIKDRIVGRLMRGRGGKLVKHSRWNRAGRIVLGQTWKAALEEAHKQNVYPRDKWFLYNDALRIACTFRNFATLSILLKFHPNAIGPQIIHEMLKKLYNGPPTEKIGNLTAAQIRDHDRANINLCVLVMWGSGLFASRSKLCKLSRTHQDFANWFRDHSNPKKMDRPVTLKEVAFAFKCPLVIGHVVRNDPAIYTQAQRAEALLGALSRLPDETKVEKHYMAIHDISPEKNLWARSWSVATHRIMSKGTRDVIKQVLLCFARVRSGKGAPELPRLPVEMWLCILASGPL